MNELMISTAEIWSYKRLFYQQGLSHHLGVIFMFYRRFSDVFASLRRRRRQRYLTLATSGSFCSGDKDHKSVPPLCLTVTSLARYGSTAFWPPRLASTKRYLQS